MVLLYTDLLDILHNRPRMNFHSKKSRLDHILYTYQVRICIVLLGMLDNWSFHLLMFHQVDTLYSCSGQICSTPLDTANRQSFRSSMSSLSHIHYSHYDCR